MNPRFRTLLRLTAAVSLAAVAVVFVGRRIGGLRESGEEGATVWFYDQSERRLYEVPRDTIPPHRGIGGPEGDGVRAVVVAFRGEEADPARRRIAYLETLPLRTEGVVGASQVRPRLRAARPGPDSGPGQRIFPHEHSGESARGSRVACEQQPGRLGGDEPLAIMAGTGRPAAGRLCALSRRPSFTNPKHAEILAPSTERTEHGSHTTDAGDIGLNLPDQVAEIVFELKLIVHP